MSSSGARVEMHFGELIHHVLSRPDVIFPTASIVLFQVTFSFIYYSLVLVPVLRT